MELPKNHRAPPCRWVFRLKQTTKSFNPNYKADIIEKGFQQEHGIDCNEIFLRVVKMVTLQFLLGVVALEDLELL